MQKLKDKRCVPCEDKDAKPLDKNRAVRLMAEISGWALSKDAKSIEKEIIFKNFDKAMDFVNIVADLAEFEGHHPDIEIRYNKVRFTLSTHFVKGLTENDFILASKINSIHL